LTPIARDTPQTDDPEDVSNRQLYIARQLATDAETARQEGKYELASRLNTSVEERLQRIINKYAGTIAANTAEAMLKKIQ
jgi:hypothetical protein